MSNSSMGLGFMAAFAVSGSVVLIAREVHKRLLSNFMKKIELELLSGSKRCHSKKRVRFADDVIEPSSNNAEYRRRNSARMTKGTDDQVLKMEEDAISLQASHHGQDLPETMPLNRQMLYKGIIEHRTLKGYDIST